MDSSQIVRQGSLKQYRPKFFGKSWVRRWIILTKTHISVSRHEGGDIQKLIDPLTVISAVEPRGPRSRKFILRTRTGETHIFQADDKESKALWQRAIASSVKAMNAPNKVEEKKERTVTKDPTYFQRVPTIPTALIIPGAPKISVLQEYTIDEYSTLTESAAPGSPGGDKFQKADGVPVSPAGIGSRPSKSRHVSTERLFEVAVAGLRQQFQGIEITFTVSEPKKFAKVTIMESDMNENIDRCILTLTLTDDVTVCNVMFCWKTHMPSDKLPSLKTAAEAIRKVSYPESSIIWADKGMFVMHSVNNGSRFDDTTLYDHVVRLSSLAKQFYQKDLMPLRLIRHNGHLPRPASVPPPFPVAPARHTNGTANGTAVSSVVAALEQRLPSAARIAGPSASPSSSPARGTPATATPASSSTSGAARPHSASASAPAAPSSANVTPVVARRAVSRTNTSTSTNASSSYYSDSSLRGTPGPAQSGNGAGPAFAARNNTASSAGSAYSSSEVTTLETVKHQSDNEKEPQTPLARFQNGFAFDETNLRQLADLDPADIKVNYDEDSNCIGIGGFAQVWKGRLRETQEVAVKKCHAKYRNSRSFLREIATLKTLCHPNIMPFIGAAYTGSEWLLVTEYCPGNSVEEYLENSIEPPPLYIRAKFAHETALGLVYLHSLNLAHLDVKPQNLVIGSTGEVKVADFGAARLLKDGESVEVEACTVPYAAPELLITARGSFSTDVFSFAVTLYRIIFLLQPYDDYEGSTLDLKEKIVKEDLRPTLPGCAYQVQGYVDLIKACWQRDPRKRPKFNDVLERLEALAREVVSTKGMVDWVPDLSM